MTQASSPKSTSRVPKFSSSRAGADSSRCRLVTALLEIWPEALARAHVDAAFLLADLEGLGFRFEDVEARVAERRALRPADILETCRGKTQSWMNLLLTKAVLP